MTCAGVRQAPQEGNAAENAIVQWERPGAQNGKKGATNKVLLVDVKDNQIVIVQTCDGSDPKKPEEPPKLLGVSTLKWQNGRSEVLKSKQQLGDAGRYVGLRSFVCECLAASAQKARR